MAKVERGREIPATATATALAALAALATIASFATALSFPAITRLLALLHRLLAPKPKRFAGTLWVLLVLSCLGQAADSGIHHKELGDGQYVEGAPQAGAGAAVGKCLTVRPVA